MAVAAQRKGVLAGMLMAVLSVAIALPFTLIHPVLPFVIVLIGTGAVLLMQQQHWLPNYRSGYLIGCLAALVILIPASSLMKFAEQGFDDGPFTGSPFTGVINGEGASDRIAYRDGELLVYNRPAKAPILAYQAETTTRWAQVLDVSENSHYADYQLTSISEPRLAYGLFRDRLDFVGTWNFGAESGRAYFWKWGQFHRFFLSW